MCNASHALLTAMYAIAATSILWDIVCVIKLAKKHLSQ